MWAEFTPPSHTGRAEFTPPSHTGRAEFTPPPHTGRVIEFPPQHDQGRIEFPPTNSGLPEHVPPPHPDLWPGQTLDKTHLWGELPTPADNLLDLTPSEREGLCKISRPLPVEGPKFHAPTTRPTQIKTEPHSDPIVTNTIQLLQYKRALEKLLDTVYNYKLAISGGSLDKMPPLAPAPVMPDIVEFQASHPSDYYTHQVDRLEQRVVEVGEVRSRQMLRQSIIQLSAHTGYHTANSSAVEVLTDATSAYLAVFTKRLRACLDQELERAPLETSGWSDVLERVAVEMGVGSNTRGSISNSILAVGDYYEDSVVKRHSRLCRQVKEMTEKYAAELPGDAGSWGQDDIPEMHFPSSEEGAGGESYSLDHATPTLDVGMQMLQSLEASGDLDTPMSAESEALSGYSATPSPQVLTPGRQGGGGSPSGKKRRVESGGKFV